MSHWKSSASGAPKSASPERATGASLSGWRVTRPPSWPSPRSPSRKSERRERIARILSQLQLHPFDEAAARRYAKVRAQLEESRQPISERDTQIAAVALSRRLTVVTNSAREFGRVAGLAVENWT